MILKKIKAAQRLEQILLNFIDVLRINLLIVDSKGKPVLVPQTKGYGFHGSSQWGVLQHLGSEEVLAKFQIEGSYLKAIDVFGFQSFAIPIPIDESDNIGYLIVGPVILNKQFEQTLYQAVAKDLKINYPDFLEALSEVRIVTFNTLKSILDLLSDLSRFALRMKDMD